ncbi:MAG: rane protein [Massilia sp.]|jgi:uncharacterized iron-regulated membrane protein|nr:rane protein [Massilia sp.]
MQQKNNSSIAARRRSILWRIHFWAGLLASPFTLVAALTGILYIFTPQIESVRHGWLDHVEPAGAMRPLDEAVAAASAAASAGHSRILFEQTRLISTLGYDGQDFLTTTGSGGQAMHCT